MAMQAGAPDGLRPMVTQAIRELVAKVRAERAALAAASAEHDFYTGVEAAAQEWLHPELAASRSDARIAAESSMFRDGYTKTANMLAVAVNASEPHFTIPVPDVRHG
ncbi:MAG: hypothetical protein ACHQIG_07610 [Acidimicrobiia bacterium]